MKIGVSSYSFKKMINSGETTQLGCIRHAKELGYDEMEFVDMLPHDGSSEEQYAKKIAAECKARGVEIGSYTISSDLITGMGVSVNEEVERVKRKLDVAAILGAKLLRHDATKGIRDEGRFKSFDYVLPLLSERCFDITQYAKTLGIKTMVENHGYFVQDSERVEKLLSAVNDENFGVLVDMGNFLCADEDPRTAVGRLAPYAFRVHTKDFHVKSGIEPDPGRGWFRTRGGNYLRGSIIGHGNVPVVQCLGILKRAGYDGTVAVEFEGMEHPILALEVAIENLKRYIGEL